MSVYVDCKRCKERNTIRTNATNRSDLEKDKGEVIKIRCSKCSTSKEYHVNEFKAGINTNVVLGAAVLGLVLAFVLWEMGFVAVLPIAIPIVVYQLQNSNIRSFNNYKIKEIVKAKD